MGNLTTIFTHNIEIFYLFMFSSFLGVAKSLPVSNSLEKIGPYQIIMFLIISMPLSLAAGFTLSYVFTAGEIKYRYANTYVIINFHTIWIKS